MSIKKNKSENGILSLQARADWIIKGNIQEGDKRTISELKLRAEVHKDRETTKPKERENLCSVLLLWLQYSTENKIKNPKRSGEIFPPFYSRLHKA